MATNRVIEAMQKNEKKPSFYKILFRENNSSESLRRIPTEFLRSVREEFRYRVILKVAWGNSWHIALSKNRRGVFMEKDKWEKFLIDNSLGDDEFLVFTHEGDMHLSVTIFEKNAVKVLEPPKPVHHTPGQYQATPVAAAGNANTFADVKTESQEFFRKRKPEPQTTDFRRKRAPKLKSNRKTTAAETSASSGFPRFTIEIKKSYLNFLAIPKTFAVRHLPAKTTEVIIRDPEGRSWEVTYLCNETQHIFSRGWYRFTRVNYLQIGDQCTFELISAAELRMNVLSRKT